MIQGLKALHDLNVCHRDIKSANIFVNSKHEVKLGDFNVSKVAK
jgi:serine/threonine protein kinase